MPTLETRIIQYLQDESKGAVNLSHSQACRIIAIVKETYSGKAILSRYSDLNSSWELIRSFNVTDAQIEAVKEHFDGKQQVDLFYRYELTDSTGSKATILCLNPALF